MFSIRQANPSSRPGDDMGSPDGFKSGEQWQVIGSQGRKEIVIERNGLRRFLPLAQAGKWSRLARGVVVLCEARSYVQRYSPHVHGRCFIKPG